MAQYKLVGGFTIPPGSVIWARLPAGSWVSRDLSANMTESYYFPTGDGGSDDLLIALEGELNALLSTISAAGIVELSVDDDGVVTWTYDDADDPQFHWSDPAALAEGDSRWIRNQLKLYRSSATESGIDFAAGDVVGVRPHEFGLWPDRLQLTDLPVYDFRGGQAEPNQGQTSTLRLLGRKDHKLGVQLSEALPRSNTWNEYHQWENFHEWASTGLPFRYYADKTISSAYSETNRFGHKTFTLARTSWRVEPSPQYGNYYAFFAVDYMLKSTS